MKNKCHCRIAEMRMARLVAAMAFQLTSCGRTSAGAAEPTPPEVQVAAVEQKDISVYREWIGTLDGQVNAAIRPQVTGYLLTQDYSEGSFVKKGQMLFQIDPRPLQAKLDLRQIRLNELLSVVRLYKALGGGWQT
jgi:membrane fusion protein (multidrug efflux system)